ncbi:MAG: cytochrome c peroxidase [Neolewinella sp.]|jgi:cytochrome c peroxidase
MKRLLLLFTFALASLTFSGCLEDNITTGSQEIDGLSNPETLTFNSEEVATLSQTLDVPTNITIASITVPQHLSQQSGQSLVTQTSSEARKALLGRVLFYDTQLSATGETSCASCHLQSAAFSDNLDFSKGINGAVTKRNSIALGSVPTFAPAISGYGSSGDEDARGVDGDIKFFWDERAETIKEQSEATIQDELEMGRDLHQLSSDLKEQEMYQILTFKAFGTTDLSPDRITLALERFTSSITSMNTRFDEMMDRMMRGNQLESRFTASEIQGMQLFQANCATCHGASMAKPEVNVANNGLDAVYTDKGVGERTGIAQLNGVFKVPFLRNIALTGPYMHDGRFETLRDVIDHYSEGIANHPNLHPFLKNTSNTARRFNFSASDKQALIDFLNTTTDETVLVDERFSDPFRR